MRWCARCSRELPAAELDEYGVCRLCRRLASYGISYLTYAQLVEDQEGKCAICGDIPSGEYPDILCVDHDHAVTEQTHIRGLLCQRCNKGLGHFRDDPSLLRRATRYLAGHPEAVGETRKQRKSNWDCYLQQRQRREQMADMFMESRMFGYQFKPVPLPGWNLDGLLWNDNWCGQFLRCMRYFLKYGDELEFEPGLMGIAGIMWSFQLIGVDTEEAKAIMQAPSTQALLETIPEVYLSSEIYREQRWNELARRNETKRQQTQKKAADYTADAKEA